MLPLKERRARVRANAERRAAEYELHERERQHSNERHIHSFDAIFTIADIDEKALALINAHKKQETMLPPQEYNDNARTALFEALSASGHLSRVEINGSLDEVNAQVMNRLLNGFNDMLPAHERKRRFKEICEEVKIQQAAKLILEGELPLDTEIITVSDFPKHLTDREAIAIGYRPYNKKGMVRSTGFRFHPNGTMTRVIEQVSRSNADAHETIMFLQEQGVAVDRSDEVDIDVLGTQLLISRHDYADGVVDIQSRIDTFSGEGIMYGELPSERTVDYSDLRKVSDEREARLGSFIEELADFEQSLDTEVSAGTLTTQESSRQYINKVREIVRAICIVDPGYTKDALGERSVAAYERAWRKMANGDVEGASAEVAANSSNEQAVVICGGGTEESLSQTMSSQQQAELAQRLKNVKELWNWTVGVCRISTCPTVPKRIKVGPCSVCVECQSLFDAKKDPETFYRNKLRPGILQLLSLLFEPTRQQISDKPPAPTNSSAPYGR